MGNIHVSLELKHKQRKVEKQIKRGTEESGLL